jgi:GAF domain-containing protein
VNPTRERQLAEAFVELADTLVADFDVVDFLHLLTGRSTELLGASAAGLLLADQHGQLRVMASSDERARLLELHELDANLGPCVACYRTGQPVADPDLTLGDPRWPRFADLASTAGFRAVHAVPLRLRNEFIGVLSLFNAVSGELDPDQARIAQALADVATIGLLQERAVRQQQLLAEQLQGALHSRIAIEQAKGLIVGRLAADMDEAFKLLRGYARNHHLRISDVADQLISGVIDMSELSAYRQARRKP